MIYVDSLSYILIVRFLVLFVILPLNLLLQSFQEVDLTFLALVCLILTLMTAAAFTLALILLRTHFTYK